MSQVLLRACLAPQRNLVRRVVSTSASLASSRDELVRTVQKKKLAERTDDVLSESYTKEQRLEVLRNSQVTVEASEDVGLVSGIPEEHIYTRRARIFKPAKNSMQSGTNNTHQWCIEFESRERWENPLMGWTSTADPLSNVTLSFATSEDAVNYCERHGYYYEIEQPRVRKLNRKSYAENFSWDKRTRVGSK